MSMWAIVGEFDEVYQERIGGNFEHHRSEEIVALFTSRQLAKAYMEKNRLKTVRRESFSGDRAFRQNSLLSRCEGAYIQEYFEPEYPIDPE